MVYLNVLLIIDNFYLHTYAVREFCLLYAQNYNYAYKNILCRLKNQSDFLQVTACIKCLIWVGIKSSLIIHRGYLHP